MIRLRTRLHNIGPHADTEIHWPRGLSAIVADNGTGKTFALESIIGAAYGTFPMRAEIKGLYDRIRHGAEKGEIEEDFRLSDGRAFRILRRIDGSNRTQRVTLHPLDETGTVKTDADGKPIILAGPLGKDFQPAVEKLLGDETTALASWFSAQNGYGNLCKLSPPERRRAFAKLIDCEHLAKRAKEFGEIANELKGGMKELSQLLAADPDFEESIGAASRMFDESEQELRDSRIYLRDIEADLARVQQRLRDIAASEQTHRATIERHETAVREASAIELRVRTLIDEIEVLGKRFANIAQHRLDVQREGVIRQRIAELEADLSAWNTARAREQRATELQQMLASARAQREAEEAKAGIQEGDEVLAAGAEPLFASLAAGIEDNDRTSKTNAEREAQRRRADLAIAALEPRVIIADGDEALAATVAAIAEEYRAAKAKNDGVAAQNARIDIQRREVSANIEDRKRDLARVETILVGLRKRTSARPETPFGEACATEKGGCAFLKDFATLPASIAEAEKEEARLAAVIAELGRQLADVPQPGTATDLSPIVERGHVAREAEQRISHALRAREDLGRERATRAAIREDSPLQGLDNLRSHLQSAQEAAARVRKATAASEAIAAHDRRLAVIQSDIATHDTLPTVEAPAVDPSPALSDARREAQALAGAKDRLAAAEQAERDTSAKETTLAMQENAHAVALANAQALERPADAARSSLTDTADVEALKAEETKNTAAVAWHRTTIETSIARKATLEQELASLRTRAAERLERQDRAASLQRRIDALSDLRKCFVGVVPILIDAQAEFLAAEVDRTLRQVSHGAFGFRILTLSTNQDGTVKEDFIFEISTKKGTQDVLECSGGEGVIIRLVIAQGIGKWQARLKGLAVPGCLCLDESLSQLDSKNLGAMVQMLLGLGSQFEQIIIVVHNEDVLAAIAQQIRMRDTGAGVKVEYHGIGARPYAHVANDGGVTDDMFATIGVSNG